MATSKSAEKRARQNEKKRQYNKSWKTRFRSVRKEFNDAIEQSEDEDTVRELAQKAIGLADKITSKGVIHQNKADRWKSRIHTSLNKFLG